MKLNKIIVLMILMIISINNVSCESGNGSIEINIESEKSFSRNVHSSDDSYTGDFNLYLNHDTAGIPDKYYIDEIQLKNGSLYGSIPGNLGDPFYIYWSHDSTTKDELVGYGSVIVHKKSYAGSDIVNAEMYFFFDEFNKKEGVSGKQVYILDGVWSGIYSYYDNFYVDDYIIYNSYYNPNGAVLTGYSPSGNKVITMKTGSTNTEHKYTQLGDFRNDYSYDTSTSFFDLDIQRTGFDEDYELKSSSIKMVNYSDDTFYYQSSPTISNTSHFLSVGTYNYYIVRQIDDYEHLIYTSYEDDKDEDKQPTLITDKTYYNTSETITINYTNIGYIYDNCYESKCDKPYEMRILYPVFGGGYETKFRQWLYNDLRDESFTLNTSFLSPENNYILAITNQYGEPLFFGNDFVVYSDNEYLSISCETESGCSTGNKNKIIIYYKINNNSNIIIKDNDDNIINTFYNIIDEGKIVYTIPGDINHLNTYPNWKIYLNNTEYPTTFNKDITVYWSLFITPTPTPIYTLIPIDENISDVIDEFKTESKPIKDLIFGLTELVIDNPDYNKDNTVDESEINHWFNSLIPGCILLLLVILFIGLRKKRK